MITESKTTKMFNHDESPKDNTLISTAAPPDGTPQPSTEIRKDNESRICSDNEHPNPKDSEITSSLPAADLPTVNTMPCKNRCDGIPPKLPKEWEERDGWIYSDGKPLCNFQILPKKLRIHNSRNGESKLTVRCGLITQDKKTKVDIPYMVTSCKVQRLILVIIPLKQRLNRMKQIIQILKYRCVMIRMICLIIQY